MLAAACIGCGGAPPVVAPSPCDPGSAYEGSECRVFATHSVERVPTPWTENGRPLTLELVVYRPLGVGPFPTLVFHHGSTGNGDDPALFRQTFTSETVAQAFADQGWMVLFPQRRGRGASDGVYDEGFEADRSRYSCRPALALAGLARALDDAEVVHQHVISRPDVDGARANLQARLAALESLNLPLGWDRLPPMSGAPVSWFMQQLVGLLLTTLAISLGAPFWFDALNKGMTVRTTGAGKEKLG